MKKFVLFQWDLAEGITYRPRRIRRIPPLPVHVELLAYDQNADLLIQIGKDPLLHQRLVDICTKVFSSAAKELEERLSIRDQLTLSEIAIFGVPPPVDESFELKVLNAAYKDQEESSQEKVKQQWEALLASLGAERAQSARYIHDVKIKVTLGAVGVAAAIVSVALTPVTAGASTVLGFVGLWRAVVDAGKTVYNLCRSGEYIQARLVGRLKTLHARFEEKSRGKVGKDVFASVFNSFLQTELANIATAQYDAELLKNKFCHVRDNAHSLAEKLNDLLDKTEDLDRQYWDVTFVGPNAQAPRTRAERAYEKMTQQIIEWLELIPTLHLRAEAGIPKADELAKELEELKRNAPGWLERLEKVIPVAVNLGFATGKVGFEAVEVVKDAKEATELYEVAKTIGKGVAAATSYADEVTSAVLELKEGESTRRAV
jgi:hypothetical protein